MLTQCTHENMVAYTEGGERFNACRGCNQVFPRFTPSPTGDAEREQLENEILQDATDPLFGDPEHKSECSHSNKEWRINENNPADVMCGYDYITVGSTRKHAAQIVREHNAHRKLVEALRAMKAAISFPLTNKESEAFDLLLAALTLAEAQS